MTSVPAFPIAMPRLRLAQGRRVVDAVTRHGDDPGALRLPLRARCAASPRASRARARCPGRPLPHRGSPSRARSLPAVTAWSPVSMYGPDSGLPCGGDRLDVPPPNAADWPDPGARAPPASPGRRALVPPAAPRRRSPARAGRGRPSLVVGPRPRRPGPFSEHRGSTASTAPLTRRTPSPAPAAPPPRARKSWSNGQVCVRGSSRSMSSRRMPPGGRRPRGSRSRSDRPSPEAPSADSSASQHAGPPRAASRGRSKPQSLAQRHRRRSRSASRSCRCR